MRIALARTVARLVTSEARQDLNRRIFGWQRRLSGRPATVHFFDDSNDPYSELASRYLGPLEQRYQISVQRHPVSPPNAAAAPAAEALAAWSHRDAQRWSRHFGLDAPSEGGLKLNDDAAALLKGDALRRRLGHYLGAMFYFEGEWYWGLDRLHYLEHRLRNAGLARPTTSIWTPLFTPPKLQWRTPPPTVAPAQRPTLHFYCSLRSPYTWLAFNRVQRLARHYGATLQLDYVLPMVMRGLPVPWSKRRYILLDAKREASRLGLPFGDIVDPVGPPTERGLAVLQRAIDRGRGEAFLESFLRGVFAEGIDAGSARGLTQLAARAGLGPDDIAAALADERWRRIAADHREQLITGGLWGVPSFRVDGFPSLWGQDRLWMVEQDLLAALDGKTLDRKT